MNYDDDAQLDAALDAIARPEPPAGHVARVLARTGVREDERVAGTSFASFAAYRTTRWLVPALAACLVVLLAAAWQVSRAGGPDLDDVLRATAAAPPEPGSQALDLNLPVLPPQAYWGMDAFDEFASLRPRRGTSGGRDNGLAGASRAARDATGGLAGSLPPALPSGLPPIELVDISAAPLAVAPLAPLEDIALEELSLTPIVVTPITEQEKP